MATAKKPVEKPAEKPADVETPETAPEPEQAVEPAGPPGIHSLGNPWDRTYGIGEVPPSRHPQASKEN